MSARDRSAIAGLQWAATAFYLVAVAHGVDRHRGSDAGARRWASIYLGCMLGGFLAGRRRSGDPRKRAAVTALLVVEYLAIRILARALDRPRGESRHLVGAGVEALALVLAHGLTYGFGPTVREGDKTQ